jgi:hypothetical protein
MPSPVSRILSPEIEPTVENLSMIRSHLLFRQSAVVTGLVTLAAFAGTAQAQLHDLVRHSNHGRTTLLPTDSARCGSAQRSDDQRRRLRHGLLRGDQPVNPTRSTAYFSDTGCDFCGGGQQSIADDIKVLAAFNVCDIQFWGGYYSSNSSPADSFTINILSDAGGCPGAAVYSESNVSVARVQTGNVLFGVNEWLYTATLASTVNLPVGTYFIEIFNNTGLGTDDWFWETGNLDPDYGNIRPRLRVQHAGITWNCPLGNDFAMVVCGDVAPPPPPARRQRVHRRLRRRPRSGAERRQRVLLRAELRDLRSAAGHRGRRARSGCDRDLQPEPHWWLLPGQQPGHGRCFHRPDHG